MSRALRISIAAGVLASAGAWNAASQSPGAQAQSATGEPRLGRLFFTLEQRHELDRRRALNIKEAPVIDQGKFTVNGHVSRSNGRTTTWINGVPEHDAYRPADPATIPVRIGEAQPPVALRIGDTLDRSRGQVTDGLSGGRVLVGKRPNGVR